MFVNMTEEKHISKDFTLNIYLLIVDVRRTSTSTLSKDKMTSRIDF